LLLDRDCSTLNVSTLTISLSTTTASTMENYGDPHYPQAQRQQSWPPHLMGQPQPFPSPPASSIPDHAQQHYPPFSQSQQPSSSSSDQQQPMHHLGRLSLNLSSLSVASPSNLSPIAPPQAATNALSPATPISPSTATQGYHHHMQSQFQFNPPPDQAAPSSVSPQKDPQPERPYGLRISTSASGNSGSRSSSTSTSTSTSGPPSRKRSFTSQQPASSANTSSAPTPLIEENYLLDDGSVPVDHDTPMDDYYTSASGPGNGPTSAGTPGGASPIDGGSGGSGGEDAGAGGLMGAGGPSTSGGSGNAGAVGSNMGMLGKPMPTNNFVTKLYQYVFYTRFIRIAHPWSQDDKRPQVFAFHQLD